MVEVFTRTGRSLSPTRISIVSFLRAATTFRNSYTRTPRLPVSSIRTLIRLSSSPAVVITEMTLTGRFFFPSAVCLMDSRTINLSHHLGDKVRIWGYEVSRHLSGVPVIDVRRLEVE